jgi:eukaryotic-like serine/threonine-protein kinase
LGRLRELQGIDADAELPFRQVWDIARSQLGADKPEAAETAVQLAVSLYEQGKPGAEEMCAAAVAVLRDKQGESSAQVSWALSQMGKVQMAAGDLNAAKQSFRESVSIERQFQRQKHPVLADGLRGTAEVLMARGDATAAEPLLREALEIQQERYNDGDLRIAQTNSNLGACLTALRQYDAAEQALLSAHTAVNAHLRPQHCRTDLTRRLLADLYAAWEKPDQAAWWLLETPKNH